ncbi:MAG: 3-isopropylmalate dehydratase [Gemmatimonadetes bacterium]|nr:3-isopropylmalate dehydratase [Gemmatimonadota bacterium]
MIERRDPPDVVRLSGRILFLTEDPELIRRQLAGEDLDWDPSIPLRDDISTDEITPAWVCYHFDPTLAEYVYIGLKCGDEFPITPGDVKRGGFVACVSGKRRGKGSSREHSPYAELMAGIRLVIAQNIERIYEENCQDLGLLTSTDFGLIERIRRGERIPLDEFTRGRDPITAAIVRRGGLYPYNVARLRRAVKVLPPDTDSRRPMTIAEKIIASHWVTDLAAGRVGIPAVKPGDAGFVRCDIRFSHEYVTPMAATFFEQYVGSDGEIREKDSVLLFRDHLAMLDLVMSEEKRKKGLLDVALRLKEKQEEFARRHGLRLHGELADRKGSEAICHTKIFYAYALPGMVILGSDSHTPHAGAVGCVAFGAGTTAIFNSWMTQDVRIKVPASLRIEVNGPLAPGVTAKDLVLEILRHPAVKGGGAIGTIVEWAGPTVRALSVDERATLTNMSAEMGAFTGIVEPDETTVEWLVDVRGLDPNEAEALCEGLYSDEGAEYATRIEVDAGRLRPMVALPGDPGRGIFVDELPGPVAIDIAYMGSCTASKREDMDMYAAVLQPAVAEGQRVPDDVRAYIQMGSLEVEEYCREKGYLEFFQRAGVKVLAPGCGACINAGPGVSTRPDEVTVSSINRNFPGRSGPGKVYLANPYTVAASALAGRIVAWQPQVPAGVA